MVKFRFWRASGTTVVGAAQRDPVHRGGEFYLRLAGRLSALSDWFFGVGWFNSSFSRGSLPACKHWGICGSSKILPATVEKNSMPKSVLMIPVGTRAAITDSMQKWSGSKPLATKIAEQEKGWGTPIAPGVSEYVPE